MNKLWCDLKTDPEKADYILSGQAYAAGIISHAIQADVAMAFTRCANYATEVRRLREENERLRGIERAAQWYVDNPNSQRMAISQIKAAIDAARGKK